MRCITLPRLRSDYRSRADRGFRAVRSTADLYHVRSLASAYVALTIGRKVIGLSRHGVECSSAAVRPRSTKQIGTVTSRNVPSFQRQCLLRPHSEFEHDRIASRDFDNIRSHLSTISCASVAKHDWCGTGKPLITATISVWHSRATPLPITSSSRGASKLTFAV